MARMLHASTGPAAYRPARAPAAYPVPGRLAAKLAARETLASPHQSAIKAIARPTKTSSKASIRSDF